jgi:hypothetical protein
MEEEPYYLTLNPIFSGWRESPLLRPSMVCQPDNTWEFQNSPVLLFHGKHDQSIEKWPNQLRKFLQSK